MAKPFGNISLEQRYKSSLNDLEIKLIPEAATMPTSQVMSQFPNTINLGSRLTQPLLGTTNHLSEYFLSDQYTNYINIKPFGVQNQISTVKITTPNPVNQGSIQINTNLGIVNQGGTTITTPTYDSLLLEGTTLSNGVYLSLIHI